MARHASQALILGCVHLAVALAIHSAVMLSAASARRLIAGAGRWPGRAAALALAGVAAWMALSAP